MAATKKQKTLMDKPGLKQLTAALQARLFFAETKGGNYKAENAKSSATGKYQFLWGGKWPWGPKIKAFAKKSGYGDITREDFLNSPDIQDEFFEQEYMPQVYNWVKNQSSNNVRNLDQDEMAQLYHLHPKQAENYIKGGTFDAGKHNSKAESYLKEGQRGLDKFSIGRVEESAFKSKEEKDAITSDYVFRMNQIVDSDYSDGAKKLKIHSLQQSLSDKGYANLVNSKLYADKEEANHKKELFSTLYNESRKNLKHKYFDHGDGDSTRYFHAKIDTPRGVAAIEQLKKESPEHFKGIKKNKDGAYILPKRDKGWQNFIKEGYNKYSGKEPVKNFTDIIVDKEFTVFGVGVHDSIHDGLLDIDFDNIKHDNEGFVIKKENLALKQKNYKEGDDIANNNTAIKTREVAKKNEGAPVVEVANAQKAKEEEDTDLQAFLNDQYLEEPDNLSYDKNDYKKKIPFDAIAGGLIGLAGLDRADASVPLRKEQVSAGVLDYAAKLSKLSQLGLPAEVEAKLKDDAASAYSGMLNQITASSGGNRNLVLGNQGQLDYNRMLANNNIEIADHQAKQDALEKYGNVMMYINEFDSRRDIDNTKMKQSLALDKRRSGQELAAGGMGSMIDALQYASENGPGSANHMYASLVRQKGFGWDPEMKDNGKGDKKGTRSYYDKHIADPIRRNNEDVRFSQENLPSLNEDQNKFVNLVATKTRKVSDISKAIKFAKSSDMSRVNNRNIGSALESGNFDRMLYPEIEEESFLTDSNKYEQRNIS